MAESKKRFAGISGRRLVREAFVRQPIVNGDQALASALAEVARVEVYALGTAIIEQGAADNDFFLILMGRVAIEVNGRRGPVRTAGDHFGEMALIDVHARRSATARALEETVVARITEFDFTNVAQHHAKLWRCLAVGVARRLRQRLNDAPPRNATPRVFIGTSKEGLEIGTGLQAGLASRQRDVVIWTDGVFGVSSTTIESLEDVVRTSDMAVLVLSSDDELRTRGKTYYAPRDNLIFELGLFMGALGRHRTFIVRPHTLIKVPSDLAGVTTLSYDDGKRARLSTRLATVCKTLKKKIDQLGPK